MRVVLVLALILLARPIRAATTETGVSLRYEAYAHGLHVLHMGVFLRLGPRGYEMRLAYHTTGLANFLFHGEQYDVASGGWDEAGPNPDHFIALGRWSGQNRRTIVAFHDHVPDTTVAEPPVAEEREQVPPALRAGTIDSVSALVLLVRRVGASGACEAAARSFDGRRLIAVSARTAGTELLKPTERSVFSGPALRCDFVGRMLAGFPLGSTHGPTGRPMRGSAWLAGVLPGEPPLPVRLRFETRWLGDITMYLTSITAGGPADSAEALQREAPGG